MFKIHFCVNLPSMGLPPFLIPFSTPELQCVIYIFSHGQQLQYRAINTSKQALMYITTKMKTCENFYLYTTNSIVSHIQSIAKISG